MHKSWGNAIEFNEAAERMGVDVMRWMYARQRPEDNILFGYHAADEARRELLVLWNVLRLLRRPTPGWPAGGRPRPRSARRRRPGAGALLDRWILSRAAGLAAEAAARRWPTSTRAARRCAIGALHRRPVDLVPAPQPAAPLAQRRRGRPRRGLRDAAPGARGAGPRAGAHPAVPGRGAVPGPGASRRRPARPDSVHLTRWPDDELAPLRDAAAGGGHGRPAPRRRAGPHAARPGRRCASASRSRGSGWRCPAGGSRPGSSRPTRRAAGAPRRRAQRQAGRAHRRRVGAGGAAGQAAAAGHRQAPTARTSRRSWPPPAPTRSSTCADGGVAPRRASTLAADEVEILATPRPGTAVAHDEGIVVVIDTELDDELRAEGDARELTRAVQDLRKQAELELDARIERLARRPGAALARLEPYLGRRGRGHRWRTRVHPGAPPDGAPSRRAWPLDGGVVRIALRGRGEAPASPR